MTTIHYINHNFSDWDSQTKHMSRLERSIYLDLRTLYFSNASVNNGKIDVSDFELLCYRLSCRTEEEISALKLLLKDKFKKNGNSYRHADWDRQIKAIQWEIKKGNTGNTIGNDGNTLGNDLGNTGKPLSNAERTAKAKAERKKLLSDLSSVGVETPVNTPIAELRALHERHFANAVGNDDGNTIGNDGNATGNTLGNDGNAQKPPNNHKPLTNNQDINTHTNAREKIFEKIGDLMAWQAPPIEEMQSELIRSGINRTLSQAQYDTAIGDFKAYYEQQAQLGKPLNTDAIRKSKLRQWLAREKPPAAPTKPPSSRMDELRAMAMTAPVNEFGELPSEHDLNFYQSTVNGVSYEQPGSNQQH